MFLCYMERISKKTLDYLKIAKARKKLTMRIEKCKGGKKGGKRK